MRRSLVIGILLAGNAILTAQMPAASCCETKIDSKTGPPGLLKVTITNANLPLVMLFETDERDFKIEVTTDAGQEVNMTDYGRRLFANQEVFRRVSKALKMGQSYSQELDLRPLFDLKSGTYNVALSRAVMVNDTRVPLQATTRITIP
jgi:hypothetical protein